MRNLWNLIDEAKPAMKAYFARLQSRPSYKGGACLFEQSGEGGVGFGQQVGRTHCDILNR